MFRVVLKQARPGMVLARALVDPHRAETALLGRGDALTPEVISFLHEAGIYDLWVEDSGLDGLDQPAQGTPCGPRQKMCDTVMQGLHTAAQRIAMRAGGSQMRDVLRALMQTLTTSNLPCIDALAKADEHIIRHGAEVCYTALLLGTKLQDYMMEQRKHIGRLQAKDLMNLALGCLFHDLGDTLLDDKDRESRRVVTDDSSPWQKHVELGFNLVRNQLDPSAAAIVMHHHQHFDGSGFPAAPGKGAPAGSQIHIFARIAFVADTFVHFLKHDSIPMPTIHSLWRLQSPTCRAWCDPVVLGALMDMVKPFVPGMVVQLCDRRFAVVTRSFDAASCYPEVQTLLMPSGRAEEEPLPRELIRLGERTDIWLQAVDGIDVTHFMYGPRTGPVAPVTQRTQGRVAAPAVAAAGAA